MKHLHYFIKTILLALLCLLLPSTAFADDAKHTLKVVSKPEMAGTFNTNTATLAQGEVIHLFAYANSNFTFKEWTAEDGTVVATAQDFEYTMPDRDVTLTAVYDYNPANPTNPAANVWDAKTGNVIIDEFAPGSLSKAIAEAIGQSKSSDVLMITVAGRMDNNDFNVTGNYSNCTLFDISRVTGITEVPSYAFDYTKLESVYLPASIEKIGYNAFYDCRQLQALTIYAMVPPVLENNVFQGVPDGLVVYVPAAAIAQYQDAEGWKDFTILPIQENIRSLTVALPQNAKAADYSQMWLELTNTKNGQKMHYVMTDRTAYTFANIIRHTSWNVVLRNQRGDVFGKIDNIEVKDEDVSVTFSNLSRPQSVSLSVFSPEGNDVTTQCQVTWLDATGAYFAQATSLSGMLAGTKLAYSVALPQELAMRCAIPVQTEYVVKETGNNVQCRLSALGQVVLTGKVKDTTTGMPLSGAAVSASQTFGGKYSKTVSAKTDASGKYTLTISNVPTSLAISASDYISQTLDTNALMDGASSTIVVPEVALKPISGAVIALNLTYTKCPTTADDEDTFYEWYSDYNNVGYSIYNRTKQCAISQYNVQYPQIVLLEEVSEGDVLELTATSKTGAFMPVVATATIDAEQRANAVFNIVELGKINATFAKNANASVAATLYDAKGKLVQTFDYSNGTLTINDLADGHYSLVTMGSSRLFNTIYDLAQLPQTGLVRLNDYVQHNVEVKSGEVTNIDIDEVPMLDESKLYYTGDNTSFTVNKSSIVAGNYLTLTGHLDFKSAYATNVSNVNLVVDLPESCQFVENSVMVGNATSTYNLDGHRVTIPMARYTDRVRFCIIPTLGGDYAPSALVQFDIDGVTVTQPIGSASYTAKDLSIIVPSTVAKTTIPVSGTAVGASSVEIYDGDVLIGQTNSLANGSWATTCELNDPYNLSTHNIYAKVTTKAGMELQSENVECTYDMNAIEVSKVTMINTAHTAANLDLYDYVTVFDFQHPDAKVADYWYWPNYPKFTFIVDFTRNDPNMIYGVKLCVYTSSGNIVTLEPVFDEKKHSYIVTHDFDSNSLPINVSVDYGVNVSSIGDRRMFDDMKESLCNEMISQMGTFADIKNNMLQYSSELNFEFSEEELEDDVKFKRLYEEYVQWHEYNAKEGLNDLWNSVGFPVLENFVIPDVFSDATIISSKGIKSYKSEILSSINIETLLNEGYTCININDGSSIIFKYDDSAITYIDTRNSTKYTISIKEPYNITSSKNANNIIANVDFLKCMDSAKSACDMIGLLGHIIEKPDDTKEWAKKVCNIGQDILSAYEDVLDAIECAYSGGRDFTLKKIEEAIDNKLRSLDDLRADRVSKSTDLNAKISYNKLKLEYLGKEMTQQEIIQLEKEIARDQKKFNALAEEIADLSRQRMFYREIGEIQIKSQFEKLPKFLQTHQRLAKGIEITGKCLGVIGSLVELYSYGCDVKEMFEETKEWIELIGTSVRKLPCECDQERALGICLNATKDGVSAIGNMGNILKSEAAAIIIDVAMLVDPEFSLVNWFASGICNAYSAINKASRFTDDINKRGNYYLDLMELHCFTTEDGKPCSEKQDPNPPKWPKFKLPNPPSWIPRPHWPRFPWWDPKDPPTNSSNHLMDPSGYVYEGVTSNRLEGVTATAYYKEMVEDMYGDLHENIVKWDAAQYVQENPLFTDKEGMYAWDVPDGLWQVKFEKEGYETTYSEWLPVPPPQLDVNIAMKQNVQPSVKMARAYPDAVEVEFDKYMMPELLTTDNVAVMANGKPVSGSVVMLNEEVSYEGSNERYASKIRFNAATPFAADEVTLIVNNRVKSYAGIRMQDDYSQTFSVEPELRTIEVTDNITVPYGNAMTIFVTAKPASAAAGKTLRVQSSSKMIASVNAETVQLDKNGKAEITIFGELPGTAGITFTVDGYDIKTATVVNVKIAETTDVAAPKASLASGSVVEKGTAVTLSCDTPDATIYYTKDGSCPCDEASRIVYTAPIIIDHTMKIRAIAVAVDLTESDVVEFSYYVEGDDGIEDVTLDETIKVYPLPVRGKLNVTAGGEVIKSVTLVSTNGSVVAKAAKPEMKVTLDVSTLASGIYFINVATEDKNYSRKIMKVE